MEQGFSKGFSNQQNQNDVEASKKYPENEDKQKQLEQIKILVKRHNYLIDEVNSLEESFDEKEKELKEFRKLMKDDLLKKNEELDKNKELIRILEKHKKIISGKFKEVVKKVVFDKVVKRVDNLNYENLIHREEFERKINP